MLPRIQERAINERDPSLQKGHLQTQDLHRRFPLRAAEYKIVFEILRIPLSTLFEYSFTLNEHADRYRVPLSYLHREQLAHGGAHV